jgi:hypothetical protein
MSAEVECADIQLVDRLAVPLGSSTTIGPKSLTGFVIPLDQRHMLEASLLKA